MDGARGDGGREAPLEEHGLFNYWGRDSRVPGEQGNENIQEETRWKHAISRGAFPTTVRIHDSPSTDSKQSGYVDLPVYNYLGKNKKRNRKDLAEKALSNQKQYDIHQEKIRADPRSLAIDHWKREKANFLSRYNYYLSKAKVKDHDTVS